MRLTFDTKFVLVRERLSTYMVFYSTIKGTTTRKNTKERDIYIYLLLVYIYVFKSKRQT